MKYIQDPESICGVRRADAEPIIREVVETFAVAWMATSDDKGRSDVALSVLKFVSNVYTRLPELSGPCIDAFLIFTEDGPVFPLIDMIKQARANKHTPDIGGFLKFLKANALLAPHDEQIEFLKASMVRACSWLGKSPQETRDCVDRYYKGR